MYPLITKYTKYWIVTTNNSTYNYVTISICYSENFYFYYWRPDEVLVKIYILTNIGQRKKSWAL